MVGVGWLLGKKKYGVGGKNGKYRGILKQKQGKPH